MKKLLLSLFFFSVFSSLIFSQDTILRVEGLKIICKVQHEDSVNVYFSIEKNGKVMDTFIQKKEISTIKYNPDRPKVVTYIDNSKSVKIRSNEVSLGVGLGLDFGGIGANLTYYPQKSIGIFAGAGYALAGVGYNVGMKLRYIPKDVTKLSSFVSVMYGYNAALVVMDDPSNNQIYYGPTVGLGFESLHTSTGYWSFSLLTPFRNVYISGSLPFAISIGYRFLIE